MEPNLQESQINWYAIKILFESIHFGNPLPDKIDEHYYDNNKKLFEESIILIKAKTIEQAYNIAEEQAKQSEHEYLNSYGQLVRWKFVNILHAFELNDDEFKTGTEIYSRFIHAKKEDTYKDIIIQYYPEALDKKDEPK
ncbi:DUF4288 domain-containing protein [Aneurinibacillus aneurinilyticus]|uniref:DUF4288 domain-containing protein n=1 Tax=Aneurinibacillus aneurinilyticus TaxID=1391 RepID=UPI0023F56A75|nr:DUF4288 domain-containing protein [Aneurinibacillus aneurinilyticus]MED0670109.1 DUF4288 domain-containing protein [Aneurinibacillus aneurinilyticus]